VAEVTYNRVTAQSVERLAALSDGIFAVAMTLLVLDLHGPAKETIHSEQDLLHALAAMAPQIAAYFMSFLTLSIFWAGQQAQLNRFERSDRQLSWIHLLFLLAVSVMPFSTRLLAEFITFRTALLAYWLNLLLLGAVLYLSWWHAKRNKLLRDETTPEISKAIERRILVAQLLYGIGAALCIVNTYVSMAAIVMVQLNFAVAPRIRWLSRF
jgi:uncharacterized membrane protein